VGNLCPQAKPAKNIARTLLKITKNTILGEKNMAESQNNG
jgi:hypothetical protein